MKPKSGNLLGIISLAVVVLSCHLLPTAEAENIVFFFGVSSYSHRIPAWPLVEALADKNHSVTFVSPYPAKNPHPKVFDYVPKALVEFLSGMEEIENVFEDRRQDNVQNGWLNLPMFGQMVCEEIYKDPEYINWVKSSKVDLVVIDGLFNDCALGMAHYWGAKVITFHTSSPFTFLSEVFGMPDETSSIPNMELFYPVGMSFTQRLKNALLPIAWDYYRKWMYFPKLEELTKSKLGMDELPSFEEIQKQNSLSFVNTHYGEEFPRSLPPNTIPVGGIAITEKRNPLPKDLEEFLEKGTKFIYMSFGTYGDFFQMDKDTQQVFIQTMNKFPDIQFVWKIGNDSFASQLPHGNVYMAKWMPQQDILAHKKIRAFITHSGLMSIQEATFNAVPLISFPIFAEQDYNAERVHRKEVGIRLEINTVTQAELEDAINNILNEKKYRKNMWRTSKLFNERPMRPLDTALWWTEFVLQHSPEELSALRPLGVGQSWWKRRQLDVWAAIISVIVTSLGLILFISLKVLKFACGKKDTTVTRKMKTQ